LVVNRRWNNVLPNSNIWKSFVFKHVFNITFHTSMDFKFHNFFITNLFIVVIKVTKISFNLGYYVNRKYW
jgi:hypothetical protein